jgi:branched-chain amino acid transport system ATP-binding protein
MSLSIDGLTVVRGTSVVLEGVSLSIAPASITALLGPNGAGKSSLVLAVAGVLRPRAGSISLDGRELAGKRAELVRAAGIAVVPEGHRVLRELSVADNLRVAGSHLSRDALREGVARVLVIFPELEPKLGAPAALLSGGQQQMLVIAQALVDPPSYLLVDELSLGLAPVAVRRLAPALVQLARDGVGVLLIEQFTTLALRLASAAYVLEGGVIRFAGTAAELKRNPSILHSTYLAGSATTA